MAARHLSMTHQTTEPITIRHKWFISHRRLNPRPRDSLFLKLTRRFISSPWLCQLSTSLFQLDSCYSVAMHSCQGVDVVTLCLSTKQSCIPPSCPGVLLKREGCMLVQNSKLWDTISKDSVGSLCTLNAICSRGLSSACGQRVHSIQTQHPPKKSALFSSAAFSYVEIGLLARLLARPTCVQLHGKIPA